MPDFGPHMESFFPIGRRGRTSRLMAHALERLAGNGTNPTNSERYEEIKAIKAEKAVLAKREHTEHLIRHWEEI